MKFANRKHGYFPFPIAITIAGALWLSLTSLADAADDAPERLSDRTVTVALDVSRERASVLSFTAKKRPFIRQPAAVGAQAADGDGQSRLEVVLLGPDGARMVQHVELHGLCLQHGVDVLPHTVGDTTVVHRDVVMIELPELPGHDRVEVAIYQADPAAPGQLRRKVLCLERLNAARFSPSGSNLQYTDMRFVTAASLGDGTVTQPAPDPVIWPEDVGDPDIYQVNGNLAEASRRINIVILPDGYQYSQKTLMETHAADMVNYLRSKTPLKEHDTLINYTLVYAYSVDSGTDQCDCGIIKSTAFGTGFPNGGGACGSSENRCLYTAQCSENPYGNIAAAELRAPARDYTIVMVNTTRYGGCGGSRAVYSAGDSNGRDIALHEIGHSIAGLADEYTENSACGTFAGNINTSTNSVTGAWPEWIADIGAPQQGAQYYTQCIFRPRPSCEMRSLNLPFCEVCRQRWALVIFNHSRVNPTAPIESQSPTSPANVSLNSPTIFSVTARLPAGAGVTNSITWRISGPGYATNTVVNSGTLTHSMTFTQPGRYALSCEVIAGTNFIKPPKNGSNVDTARWTIDTCSVLEAPRTVSPVCGSSVASTTPTLTWSAVTNATGYTVRLFDGNACSGSPIHTSAQLSFSTLSYVVPVGVGLQRGLQYAWQVRVEGDNLSSCSSAWSTCCSFEVLGIPDGPSQLVATAANAQQVNLAWIDNASTEEGFKVEQSLGSSGAWTEIATLPANAKAYNVTGLSRLTTYVYRVRAYNIYGDSDYSNTAVVITPDEPPSAPTNFAAAPGNADGQIILTWTDTANNEIQYNIERSVALNGTYVLVANVTSNTTAYTNSNLAPCTPYYYRIRAYGFAGYSEYSDITSATTPGCTPQIPVAPANLSVRAISASSIVLTWTDLNTQELGYKIQRSISSTGPWTLIATTGANASGHTDTGLAARTQYYYKVCAFNAAGRSSWAGPVGAKTAKIGTPIAPSNLTATAMGGGRVDLSWTDNSGNETLFKIFRRVPGSSWSLIGNVTANVTTFSDNDATAGLQFDYRVKAINQAGSSPSSNIASVTASPAASPADPGPFPLGIWHVAVGKDAMSVLCIAFAEDGTLAGSGTFPGREASEALTGDWRYSDDGPVLALVLRVAGGGDDAKPGLITATLATDHVLIGDLDTGTELLPLRGELSHEPCESVE
jgi:hypothetical protein